MKQQLNPTTEATDFEILLKTNVAMRQIRRFAKENKIPTDLYCVVLHELHELPELFVEEVKIGGEVEFTFAPRVMQRMLELENKLL